MYIRSLLLMALLASCGGGTGSKIVQEEVAPPNNSPVLTNISDYSVLEGDAFSLSIVASDVDDDVLTYSLLGADAEQFSLSESNVLVFAVVPDFESPQDTNADNKYELTVTVSDGRADDSANMTVQVEDALEGRVVDGPITGAVLKLSGSSDVTETGPDGFFSFGAASDALGERVTALGGVDAFTGVALPDLVLMSDVLASVEESTAVNAITTLLAMADDPDSRSAVLNKLGLELSQRDVSVMDIWAEAGTESGDARSRYAQHINAQLSLFLLTGQSFAQTLTGHDPVIVVEELASKMVHVLMVSDSTKNLADSRVIALALSAALEALGEEEGVFGDQLPKVSASLADVMTVLGDFRLNPKSDTTASVSRVGQEAFQLLVQDLVANRTDIASFEQAASLKALFSSIPRNSDDIDTDSDGLSDVLDADDDGDGIRDVEDAFPLDSAEAIDTDGDGVGDNEDSDDDGDGSADIDDIFPLNPDESLDTDGDGVGNNADLDDDNDGVQDEDDAFPLDSAETTDTDGDGVGNTADFDDDGDGSVDLEDAFPLDPDESEDTDGDGIGNNTDPDDDNDGVLDVDDALPLDSTETIDTDRDGIGNNADPDDDGDGVEDVEDAFPLDSTETADTDGDGTGNNADPDDDGDGAEDAEDAFPLDPDESADTDGDGIGNNIDLDDDNDGVPDVDDAFPLDSAEAIDTDGDGVGDNEDSDDDGDGSADIDDIFPLNPDESLDTDGDGVGNNADLDDDNDGVQDDDDAFPLDSTETKDTDGDGVGNNADFDDDGDGSVDLEDAFPLDPDESEDTDGDGIGNNTDPDDDNDGVLDVDDALPLDSTETIDTDRDGIGNNADPDDDGDGVEDIEDAFPLDSTETTDSDGDGIGNNADPDDDGDGVDDEDDIEPLNPSVTGFFVGGHLLVDAGIALDSDTNDPGNDFVRNNISQRYEPDPDTAQKIESPFMLHGYVNKPFFGPEGASFELGDEDDFFIVDVLEGQRFTLLIDDYLQGDLDFYLWDDNLQIVASSESAGPNESLSAPADGTYYLNIYAWSGASTYSVETDFVSDQEVSSSLRYGEAIVTLAEDKGTSKNSKAHLFGELEKRHGLVSLSGGSPSTKLFKARQDSDLLTSRSTHPKFEFFFSRGLREKAVTHHLVKALLEDPSVERAQPNYIYFPTKITNDTLLSDMWNLSQISIPQAWEISSGDPAVVVAVIDTGVMSNHPDLSGRAVHGYDFISRSGNTDGDGIDADPEDSMLDIDTCDGRPAFYHGSHVAGTIGATGDNAEGIVGASYSASLMHLRALDGSCGGTTYDIVQAIRYSLGAPNDSGTIPDKPADIINMSLGGGPFDEYFSAAVNDAFESGVIVIAASGNTGGRVEYPARYESVIGVGASGFEGAVTSYSNKGVDLGLVAPGGDNAGGILSLHKIDNEYTYTEGQGTSMASPHVAGVVALMKSIHPNLSPSRFRELIDFGLVTDDINDPGFDSDSGWGRVNANKAVETALADANGSLRLPARIVLSARQLYFDSGDISTSVSATNPGDMSLSLNSVTASTLPWVSISRTNTDSAGSVIGTWLISVDRANLSAGFYRGSVTFSGVDEEGTEVSSSLVLSMKVADDGEGDLGLIRVALFDANTGASVWNSSTGKSNGYSYRLGVPKQGEYRIVARTDTDNSGVKCGFGDYCGGGVELLVEPTLGFDFRILRQGDTAERAK